MFTTTYRPLSCRVFARPVVVALFLIVALLVLSHPADSHPHIWIDNRLLLFSNDDGTLSSIEYRWDFDELYTAFVTDGKLLDADLEKVASEILQYISSNGFYTEIVYAENQKIRLKNPKNVYITIKNDRLVLGFTLVPEGKHLLRGRDFRIRIFDPTYYIDVAFVREEVRVVGLSCKQEFIDPNPGAGLIAMAQGLDKGQTETAGLGKYFAETLRLFC